jgi:uncharacterized protein YdiU (UPF0061 family)
MSQTPNSGWNFDNSYARLPGRLYVRQNAASHAEPSLAILNRALAARLGLDAERLAAGEALRVFSGNELPLGAEPLAQAYAGHQFGGFTMLGDGRAVLLGEQVAPDGERFDIQFKGSGITPFSRRGDGKAALGPMLREYLISEAMHALGIPTTRSLAVVKTGEPVYRDEVQPGAVLTRVAASHIRVGTFQYAAAIDELPVLKALADHTLRRHYPELAKADNPYLALLHGVMERQAALVARWMHVGFIHGVMNTDNMAISGETIDYGPCAFMDAYHPDTVFSSIDQQGRYAYSNQPPIAQWNLARFAETLLPLIAEDSDQAVKLAEEVIYSFPQQYEAAWLSGMRAKLGLLDEQPDDLALVNDLLAGMQTHGLDFTNTFRSLASRQTIDNDAPRFQTWLQRWKARLEQQAAPRERALAIMRKANPAVIPRNHQVEFALAAAVRNDDLAPFERLLAVLANPFEDTPENEEFRSPPPPSERVYQTFCGT